MLLNFFLFGNSFLAYNIEENLSKYTENSKLLQLYSLANSLSALIGLFFSCFINLKYEKNIQLLALGLIYCLTYFLIGPWNAIFSNQLWVIIIGLTINGTLYSFLTVHLLIKIFYVSIHISSYTLESLLCECIGAIYILSFSIACFLGPIFSMMFSSSLNFGGTSSVVGLFGIIINVSCFIKTKTIIQIQNNALETAPAENGNAAINSAPITDENEFQEKSQSKLFCSQFESNDIISEPPFEITTFKKDIMESYDFNYLSIQAGYTIEKECTSLKIDRFTDGEPSTISPNKTLQTKHFLDIEDTIEEQKFEESLNEIPEEDIKEGISNNSSQKKNSEEPVSKKYKLPLFKEVHVEEQPSEHSISEKIEKKDTSYRGSKEIVEDLNKLFPKDID